MADIEFSATVSILGNSKKRIIIMTNHDGKVTVYKKDKSKQVVNDQQLYFNSNMI